jgi:hypothetical protein
MGDFYVKSSKGMINNTSYFEIFGNAYMDTPLIKDLGVKMKTVSYKQYTQKRVIDYGRCLLIEEKMAFGKTQTTYKHLFQRAF